MLPKTNAKANNVATVSDLNRLIASFENALTARDARE